MTSLLAPVNNQRIVHDLRAFILISQGQVSLIVG